MLDFFGHIVYSNYIMKDAFRIQEKVFSFIRTHEMILPGDKVIVGVSGGADSVCLLFMLLEWSKMTPLNIIVAHINHGIRKDAVRDADYVKSLCESHNIPFYQEEIDVPQKAIDEKISEEEAGRIVRYEVFERATRLYGATKIAVAHNNNDRAETMLFHLFRGSGITGLSSIRPKRDQIIRPILCLERKEIETYLNHREIAYCLDDTNDQDVYTRNRIRHHILPYAEQEVAGGCVSHMGKTADMLLEIDAYLEEQTQAAYHQCVTLGWEGESKHFIIAIEGFQKCHEVIQKRLLFMLIKSITPNHQDISNTHIMDGMTLFTKEGNRVFSLPHHIRCRREYENVIIQRQQEENKCSGIISQTIDLEQVLQGNQEFTIENYGKMVFSIISCEKWEDIPQNQYTKWFDYDKMEKSLMLRTRQTGDYISIRGNNSDIIHKTVKNYMLSEKIPREQREQILLLTENSHAIWVVGHRISEYYKVNRNTKRVLQVQLRRDHISV